MYKRFENFSREDLQQLRNEIVLNSLYVSDYNNSFGISANSVCDFFDSFMSFIDDLAKEDNYIYGDNYGDHKYPHTIWDFFEKYDTIDNLENWYGCYEGFDWVQYDEDEDLDEIADAA